MYREALEESGLRVGAVDDDGEVRAMELDGHPFLVGTLFLPQMRSRPGKPHPVLAGFAAAAVASSMKPVRTFGPRSGVAVGRAARSAP